MNFLSKNRWIIVSLVQYLIYFFVSQLNHYISPLNLQIMVFGIFISFSAIELSFNQGCLSIIPIALTIDAKTPLPFGFTVVLFVSLLTIAHIARSRVRREITASSLATSFILTLLLFLAYSLQSGRSFGPETLHAGSIALNLLLSLVVVGLLNRIYFETQIFALSLFGINLAEEQRQSR